MKNYSYEIVRLKNRAYLQYFILKYNYSFYFIRFLIRYSAWFDKLQHCTALNSIVLHCTAQHSTQLQYTAQSSAEVHYTAFNPSQLNSTVRTIPFFNNTHSTLLPLVPQSIMCRLNFFLWFDFLKWFHEPTEIREKFAFHFENDLTTSGPRSAFLRNKGQEFGVRNLSIWTMSAFSLSPGTDRFKKWSLSWYRLMTLVLRKKYVLRSDFNYETVIDVQ